MIRLIKLLCVSITGLLLLYVSRFWIFAWWERPGLFGLKQLPPQGGLLQRWLWGTDFAPYELLIWFMAGFLILTWLQKLFDWLSKPA